MGLFGPTKLSTFEVSNHPFLVSNYPYQHGFDANGAWILNKLPFSRWSTFSRNLWSIVVTAGCDQNQNSQELGPREVGACLLDYTGLHVAQLNV